MLCTLSYSEGATFYDTSVLVKDERWRVWQKGDKLGILIRLAWIKSVLQSCVSGKFNKINN